jgi:hypothetical protein
MDSVAYKSMVIASTHQIKEERKTLNIIFERMFKYVVNDAEVHVDLEEAWQWFARIELAKHTRKNPVDQNVSHRFVMCMTSD